MPPRIKIEDVLPSGERITVTLEGRELDPRRVLQVLEMVKLMGGDVSEGGASAKTLKEELWEVILENFGDGTWFSVRDLYNIASRKLSIKLTSVSTYLTRFVEEGRLIKRGSRPRTRYRVRAIYARI